MILKCRGNVPRARGEDTTHRITGLMLSFHVKTITRDTRKAHDMIGNA
jgi:hypothetical protein